jgi:branched-chain amino acid transport system ATP-binding protein
MLRVEGLSVAYDRLVVVHDVNLELNPGEIVGLVGPNAAGKTTTLMALAGALRPRAGRVILDGAEVTGRRPEELVRAGITLVPEGRRVSAGLSVDENLQLGAISRRADAGLREEIDATYERFPALADYRDLNAASLSGGEQQQLAIARALMAQPRLLLVDEASLGLSPVAIEAVFEILAKLRAVGRGVLVVEHDVERVISVADRVYALVEGNSIYMGEAAGIDPDEFEALYLGARGDAGRPVASGTGARP